MYFTRVVELDDAPILPFAPTPPQSAHSPGGPPFASRVDGENDNTSSNTPGRGSGGSSQIRRPPTEEESDSDDEDIQGFVRIMLISKAKKANRPASAPTGNLAEVLKVNSQINLWDPGAAVVSKEAEDSVEAPPDATSDDDELSDVSSESAQDTIIKQKDSSPNTTAIMTCTPRQATEVDRKRHKIAPGYSLKNWDPTEEPILLLGSVFDSNSLGKWIYDWTVFHHGTTSPVADMAGEWLLDKLRKLLKVAEAPMLKADRKFSGKLSGPLPKAAGVEFIETIFGREKELDQTECFMQAVRLFNVRFDDNCEEILRYPLA
ncbi:vegetative cell wall protein gp1 [Colletotrichum sojae]|uniref:Vegetative cell wall protein gp1 n=1 Tax=Colletotrichum sojae TaxID=2175907 RepID=A0A8H6MNW0_9PEZI|nr:vegetative cell wall protein gp1 [Colletotrichum sojae]